MRNREKGQAITEFVVSLIGILFVFLGLVVVAILSMENVRSVLDARSEVDAISEQGSSFGGKDAQSILEWSNGADNIPFTGDDVPKGGSVSVIYSSLFDTSQHTLQGPIADENGELKINQMTLLNLSERGYVNGDAANVSFLGAANLNGATYTVRDPLSRRGLPDMETLLRSFTGNSSFYISDTVYMPTRVD